MKKIFLIRNAEHSLANKQQWPKKDTGLSAEGREQAIRLAKAFSLHDLSAVCASTHARAAQTGEIIAGRCNRTLVILPAFDPIALGTFEGMAYRDVGKVLGHALLNEIVTAPSSRKDYLQSGETLASVAERAWEGLLTVVDTATEGKAVAVSTHEEVIGLLLCRIVGIPLKNVWMWGGQLELPSYGAITELLHDGRGWKIVRFGCACVSGAS